MKKLVITLAAVVAASALNAMSVDWKFTGSEATDGLNVYVLTSWPDTIESADTIASAAAAGGQGKIAKAGRAYSAAGTLDGLSGKSGDTVSMFYAVVGTSGTDSYYFVTEMSGTLYDPTGTDQPVTAEFNGKEVAAPGGNGWVKIATGGGDDPGPGPDDPPGPGPDNPPTPGPGGDGDVPEPTSGLLLMIGGAALALRRRR